MVKWHRLNQLQDYLSMLTIMERHVDNLINRTADEIIYSLEHNEVYTAGRLAKPEELICNQFNLPTFESGRGGKYTYHGPGQLVVYPLLNLGKEDRSKDVKKYVRDIENIIIASLDKVGIKAYTIAGMVGVWTKQDNTHAKIAAIGIRVKKWITYHGLCINISPDLSRYDAIIPCGIGNFPVTSLDRLGVTVTVEEFL